MTEAIQEATQRRGRIINDPELLAMAAIADILQELGAEQADRVLQWSIDRYGQTDLARRNDSAPVDPGRRILEA